MGSTKRILVADPLAPRRDAVTAILAEHGAVVTAADTLHAVGPEVRRAARDQRPYDLLIAAIERPDDDGEALIAGLRAIPDSQTLPVVAITPLRAAAAAVAGAGFAGHVAAPIRQRALLATVERVVTETRWPATQAV